LHQDVKARLLGRLGYVFGAKVVNSIKALRAPLMQNANKIYGGMCIPQRVRHGFQVAHIRLDRVNLADISERLQVKCKVGPAGGGTDPPATLRQGAHHMTPDKARAAKDCRKPARVYALAIHSAVPRRRASSI
jgi:hypothetical protein